MPDLDITTPDGPTRVFELLRDARPVLLSFDGSGLGISATVEGPWTLPVVGEVPAPSAVLIRPDGHVAWVGEGTTDGLDDALHRWGFTR